MDDLTHIAINLNRSITAGSANLGTRLTASGMPAGCCMRSFSLEATERIVVGVPHP